MKIEDVQPVIFDQVTYLVSADFIPLNKFWNLTKSSALGWRSDSEGHRMSLLNQIRSEFETVLDFRSLEVSLMVVRSV